MIKAFLDYSSLIHLSKVVINSVKQKITYYFDGKIETQTFANSSEFDDAVSAIEDGGFLLIGGAYYNKARLSIAEQNTVTVTYQFIGNVTIAHEYDSVADAEDAVALLEDSFFKLNNKYYNASQMVVANTDPYALEITYDFGGTQIKINYEDSTEYDEAVEKIAEVSGVPGGGGDTPTTKKVATPKFTPSAGGVAPGTTVAISCTTDGATIHYTVDGSAPTTSSPTYSTPIAINQATTIKAIAVKDGMENSNVATAAYTVVLPKVANPTFTPSAGEVLSGTTVTIACSTDGASIHYTTDGSTPTTESPVYSTPIEITTATTIKAIGVKENYDNSSVVTAAYTIGMPTAETPTFTPLAGEVTLGTTVAIASTTPNAVIHYTTNGSTPTVSSPTYSEPIEVTTDVTIKAIAVADGYKNSSVASAHYTIKVPQLNYYAGWFLGDESPCPQLTEADVKGLSGLDTGVATSADSPTSPYIYVCTQGVLEQCGRITWAYPAKFGKCNYFTDGLGKHAVLDTYFNQQVTVDGVAYEVYVLKDPLNDDPGEEYPQTFTQN